MSGASGNFKPYNTSGLDVEGHYLYINVVKEYLSFCKLYKLSNNKSSFIDTQRLYYVCQRYCRDLDRVAVGHPLIKVADSHKRAAILTYWICKIKPITMLDESFYKKRPVLAHAINEIISLFVSIGAVNAENEVLNQGSDERDVYRNRLIEHKHLSHYFNDLLYNFRHCNMTIDSLQLIYFFIDITSANTAFLSSTSYC